MDPWRKQHTNMIKSASVWIWVEGWLLKVSLSKSRAWDHGLSLMLILSFFLFDTFFIIFSNSFFSSLFFITYSPCLFFRLVWRMERDLKYMKSLFCGKMERHVCGEVEGMSMLPLSVRVKHKWWSVHDLDLVSMVYHSLGSHNLTRLKQNLSNKKV